MARAATCALRAGPFVRLSLLSLLRSPLPALHLLLSANIWLRIGAQGARAPQVQPGGGSVHCVLALTAFVCAPAGRAAPHALRRCAGPRPGTDPGVGARAHWFTHMLRYCTFNARGLASPCPLVSPNSTRRLAHTAGPPALCTARPLQPVPEKARANSLPAHSAIACSRSSMHMFHNSVLVALPHRASRCQNKTQHDKNRSAC